MSSTQTRPYDYELDSDEDDDQLAHIVVPKSAVTEAYILGTPVTALCGKQWVPHRDPDRLPLCQVCVDINSKRLH